ncbi:MAG: hypothetical protein JWM98_2534 [Thermoleophilia bacterium]|nr:hypothetical protein [Thermoleophilia bacterium]
MVIQGTGRRIRTTLVMIAAVVAALLGAGDAVAAPVVTTPVERDTAATAALAKVGRPYRTGMTGPGSFDCSGLVDFSYRVAHRHLGVRTSFDMWGLGAHVTRAGMRRGDIVFTWDRAHGHVGIYLGGNKYVHAPAPGRTVQVAVVPSGAGWVGAVRP